MSSIVVLGIHRGGTSAIAGVLHHLGVHMGDDLLLPSPHNPKGYFEDREFVDIHNQIIGDWKDPQVDFESYRKEYTALIKKREEQHELWGVKDPRMCFVFSYFARIARGCRVISVCRDPRLCAESLFARGGHTLEEAIAISWNYWHAKYRQLDNFPCRSEQGQYTFVDYERLLADPEHEVHKIARFVGLKPTQEAIDFIDPTLRHHRR